MDHSLDDKRKAEPPHDRDAFLNGRVVVDVGDPKAADALDQAILELRTAGWRVSEGSDGHRADIHILRNTDAENPDSLGASVLPRREPDVKDGVVPPDGHAILRALGGGILDVALADSVVSNTTVTKVLVGLNWTMVRAGSFCGIARSPDRGTEGGRTVRSGEPLAGKTLAETARMLLSLDPLRRSIGLAAVNAFWNRPGAEGDEERLWGFADFQPPGNGLVIVGGFREAQQRLPNAQILEREPKPGDFSVCDTDSVLTDATAIAITGQTLMNASLERLLRQAAHVPKRLLIGPSVPICPLLLEHGLTGAYGIAISDADATEQFIAETGTMIVLDSLMSRIRVSS